MKNSRKIIWSEIFAGRYSKLSTILDLLRVNQYYKNLVIFIPLLFSGSLANIYSIQISVIACAIFCITSSGIYLFNDIIDQQKDKFHPKKSTRPIASNKVKIKTAYIICIVLLLISFIFGYLINILFLICQISYATIMVVYTIFLKNIALIDIMVIGTGFPIRAIAGCLAISVIISPWLIFCTFMTAVLLALGKRKTEISMLKCAISEHRSSYKEIEVESINPLIIISASILITAYSFYSFIGTGNEWMMITIPIAIFITYKYIILLFSGQTSSEPERFFIKPEILLTLSLWAIVCIVIIYGQTTYI